MPKHTIIMYRFTGWQGPFFVPKRFCEECDVTLSLVKSVLAESELEQEVELVLRPWWLWWLVPLVKYGSWKAPQLIVDGTLISQGTVPDKKKLEEALGV